MNAAVLSLSNKKLAAAALAGGALLALAIGPALVEAVSPAGLPLQTPDWSVLAGQSLVVQLHLAAAVTALLVGGWLMFGPKGRTWHRRLGWVCSVLVMIAAVSSFWIRRANGGDMSLIHGLSAWTVIVLPVAVTAARRHKVVRHRRMMTGLFYGGLVLAGLLAFLPGRVLHQTFFG